MNTEADITTPKNSAFRRYLKNSWLRKNPAIVLSIGAIISVIATYFTMAHSSSPFGPDPKTVNGLMLLDLAFILALSTVVLTRLIKLWIDRRRGSVGSRLQTRIILWFSLITIIPTITVAIFSTIFFTQGIQAWFDERVSTAIESSVAAADGYLTEHKNNIRADVLAMANDLDRQASFLSHDKERFKKILKTQAALRTLTEAFIFQQQTLLAKSDMSFSAFFDFDTLPDDALKRAISGEVVVLTNDDDDRVHALIKLRNYFDTYLLVGRFVDSKVLEHLERARGSSAEYQRLKSQVSSLQIQFSIIFAAVAMLLLLISIWAGMLFASALARPIAILIDATERVKAGDFDTYVEERAKHDEIGTLARAFNRMTTQLKKQRTELIDANRQIDARRRFSEAILSGVSAGVIALDKDKNITMCNYSASHLLSIDPGNSKGQKISNIIPEISALINDAFKDNKKTVQDRISVTTNDKNLILLIRIAAEMLSDEVEGYVVTFDDITQLEDAQRHAAWADVARRVAHEIKNPLTPIHLAAERIKKKYSSEITTDLDSFNKYIDTITRHVGDIGLMVDEFVDFARMPAPKFRRINICKNINDVVFSQKVASPSISYNFDEPDSSLYVNADNGQVSQVFTNIIKNASESLLENGTEDAEITIAISSDEDNVTTIISDNGSGFSEDILKRATEPYITSREKGTGLGLAIVRKIITDHQGTLLIANTTSENSAVIGARVTISLPMKKK